jgi:hypothetical protein
MSEYLNQQLAETLEGIIRYGVCIEYEGGSSVRQWVY